ncbi:PhoH family protein [Deinococcus radiodurans]|uniref:PhoH-like protein n=1 Tax=Deinococcus radiodurans (strain ATCC 13939 / DSM 20539 / JCM 16871 / CCUG 27074 / LMG 4051 / NBRC 15346 / NCIMB 9279 / VKM B-1422 / R1) TaxID=243230 RepID=Q9RSY1_DEIRA|nr:PhoH-related protein [Deinococcus radiodurans R1 = ATCC 13939 = DSM 20539]ANC70936.1 phosphate starvation-inducible protein PhoH [Deinococcus radiodurans R1 = ATCC 13939 = DSM 20539]QEM71383.1 PhoH family protein [Deinococcus radiodurans]UDL01035.1 PhoH family protein [Deinococcus radiodurans R1 = ATCC 13939 = DSM 20539]HCE65874.1 PhoH family protein [Deinococcus radiodurans]
MALSECLFSPPFPPRPLGEDCAPAGARTGDKLTDSQTNIAPRAEDQTVTATVTLNDQREAYALLGANDANLRRMRELTRAKLIARGETVTITGDAADVEGAERMVRDALDVVRSGGELTPDSLLRSARLSSEGRSLAAETQVNGLTLPRGLKPKTPGQKLYLDLINESDITFGVGPAGTGKTYMAVAMAVQALKAKKVKRIILTRPAVEAGEKLGFLPGDLQAKIDPYLRPLYDSLQDMLDQEKFEAYLTSGVIEIAPLAFMRGRTLNDAFIILDEAQNTTGEQMKMFLTRMGFSSKVVVTGDVTQIDLPRHVTSGLAVAKRVLSQIEGIGWHEFTEVDVVRHPLVGRIIKAYDAAEQAEEDRRAARRGELASIPEHEHD